MGVSGKPAELLKIESALCDQIPVVRRFTGEVLLLSTPTQYLSLSYAIKMLLLAYNHILNLLCLGLVRCTTKFSKELGISTFVKMIMYLVTTSLVEMLNQLLKTGGSTTHLFYGTMRSETWLT